VALVGAAVSSSKAFWTGYWDLPCLAAGLHLQISMLNYILSMVHRALDDLSAVQGSEQPQQQEQQRQQEQGRNKRQQPQEQQEEVKHENKQQQQQQKQSCGDEAGSQSSEGLDPLLIQQLVWAASRVPYFLPIKLGSIVDITASRAAYRTAWMQLASEAESAAGVDRSRVLKEFMASTPGVGGGTSDASAAVAATCSCDQQQAAEGTSGDVDSVAVSAESAGSCDQQQAAEGTSGGVDNAAVAAEAAAALERLLRRFGFEGLHMVVEEVERAPEGGLLHSDPPSGWLEAALGASRAWFVAR
jgi:hypothetical protein